MVYQIICSVLTSFLVEGKGHIKAEGWWLFIFFLFDYVLISGVNQNLTLVFRLLLRKLDET